VIFHLDAPSPSICMLIQLEKHATEEDGGTASVYSRKEPVSCLDYNHNAISESFCTKTSNYIYTFIVTCHY
jgi:hypothetical protein